MLYKQKNQCVICGKMMAYHRSFNHVCSSKCKRERDGVVKPPLYPEMNCIVCNALFFPKAVNNKTCSKECGRQNNRNSKTPVATEYSLFKRDNFTCIYCGKSSIEDGVKLHLDHITPLSFGGLTVIDNIITCCKPCNVSKSAILLPDEVLIRVINVLLSRNKNVTIENFVKIEAEIEMLKRRDGYRKSNLVKKPKLND